MKKHKMSNLKVYLLSIAIPLMLGIISALVTMGEMEEYKKLVQPPLAPPSWLFPIAWTILYTLMGISSARVFIKSKHNEAAAALWIYFTQLIMNVVWPFIYFSLELRLTAFIWLIAILGLVIAMAIEFKKVDTIAAFIEIPYITWLVFAGYLNLSTYILNG